MMGSFDFLAHSSQDSKLLKTNGTLAEIRKSVKKNDLKEIYRKLNDKIMGIPIQPNTNPGVKFGHMIGGYASAYYGYLWSQVYAQDLFT